MARKARYYKETKRTQESFREVARTIRKYGQELDAIFPSGLRMIGEEIKADVVASRPGQGVPRRDGHLAGSIGVSGGGRGMAARVEIHAGGATVNYAYRQHERMDYRHKLGEARYLVRGIERWRPDGSSAWQALKANSQAAVRVIATRSA